MNNSQAVSTFFQVALFFGATSALALFFVPAFYRFKAHDRVPVIQPYSTAAQTSVRVGLHIDNFVELDMVKNNFIIEGSLWFWYDPEKVSREQVAQFSIDQAVVEKSEPTIVEQDGLEIAHYTFRATTKMQLNYRNYPLDDHQLYLMIKNDLLSASNVQFVVLPENVTMSQQPGSQGYICENAQVTTGVAQYQVNLSGHNQEFSYNRVLCTFDCNRSDMRHFLNIFLPLFLIFFLTLFSFSFVHKEHLTDVPAIAAASIPALFAYRFVIESLSPDVSYFMVSDYLFFLYLGLSLTTFLCVSHALNAPVRVKKIIISVLYGVMLVGCALIVWTL